MCNGGDVVHLRACLSIRLPTPIAVHSVVPRLLPRYSKGFEERRPLPIPWHLIKERGQGRPCPPAGVLCQRAQIRFYSTEKNSAVLSLQGVSSRTQGITGSWGWTVTGSFWQRVQSAGSNCCSNGISNGDRFLHQKPVDNLWTLWLLCRV